MWARALSLALAFWLMVSVFFWPHSAQEWMTVGLWFAWVLVVMSAASFVVPQVRFGAAVLGAILAVYALVAHHAVPPTRWHDFAVGVLFLLQAFVPSQPVMRREIHPERRISS